MAHNASKFFVAVLISSIFVFQNCKKDTTPTRFTLLKPAQTNIEFSNIIPDETPDGMNIIQYLYYYNGGGTATGDLNNDGRTDLFFTSNLQENKLYFNKGMMQFEDVSAQAGIQGTTGTWNTGVSLVDINADGWLDIYVCRVGNYKKWHGANQLFINNQNGTFTDQAAAYGLDISAFSTQATFTDIDNDGDLDCFLLCHSVHSPGSYRDTAQTRKKDMLAADRLMLCEQQNGVTRYRDVSDAYGIYGGTAGYGLGVVAGDVNGDHFTDFYVANDFHENDYLYINQQGKGFKESITAFTGHTSNFSMGCDMADYNNDALPDLISLDMRPEEEFTLKASQPSDLYEIYHFKHQSGYHWQFPRNALQLNQTTASDQIAASEIAFFAGVAATDWSWSALFTDLDLDGWKDLYITNGIVRRPNDMDYIRFTSSEQIQQQATDKQLLEKMPDGAAPNYCFKNTSYLDFQDVSGEWGLNHKGYANGAVYADLDNDGDPDLVTNNINEVASIWQNNTIDTLPGKPYPRFLQVKLKGIGGNTHAIGAKIWAFSGDTVQYFENHPVRGFQSCVEPGRIYIGAANTAQLDSLMVRWPDGRVQVQYQVNTNQELVLQMDNGGAGAAYVVPESPMVTILQEISSSFVQPEDIRANMAEKLQPWSLTNIGPRPGVSSSYLFIPGTNGGDLFRWDKNGSAIPLQKIEFAGQGVCAVFLDANGDKLEDLYIGTAPNATNRAGADWLFLNKNGRFEPAPPDALPASPVNTSCAVVYDYDQDGDMDVFAGGRSEPGAYGVIPRSYLLENDGKGHLSDVTDAKAPKLSRIGMVTDAVWAEINGIGAKDLVLCGEWMPVHIFFNMGNVFSGMTIPESSGLWNTIVAADFDHDGDLDLMGGNLGTNSVLKVKEDEPLELWVKDFDSNGQTDPVMTYYRAGKKYPVADKDLLLSQMPFLKKRYISYRTYAGHSFDEVFPADLQKDAAVYRAEIIRSSYFEQKPNGLWTISSLSDPIQWAPVYALAALDKQDAEVWVGGNTHQVSPMIGRMDALPFTQMLFVGDSQFAPVCTDYTIRGAVRSIQIVRDQAIVSTDAGKVYIVRI